MLRGTIAFLRGGGRFSAVGLYTLVSALPGATNSLLALYYAFRISLPEFGAYAVLLSVILFINNVIDLGLSSAIIRQYFSRGSAAAARSYLSSVFFGGRLLSLGVLAVVGVVLYLVCNIVGFAPRFIPLVLLVGFLDRSLQTFAAIFRTLERPAASAAAHLLQSIFSVLGALLLVGALRMGLAGALLALIVGRSTGVALFSFFASREGFLAPHIQWRELRQGVIFGLPLLPARIATWGRQVAIRPLLSLYVPLSSVGIFMFGSTLSSLPQILSSAIDLALAPIYFRRREAGDAEFGRRVVQFSTALIAMLLPVWIALIVFSPAIGTLFPQGRASEGGAVLAILLVASFARFVQPFLHRQVLFLNLTWILPFLSVPCAILALAPTVSLRGSGIVTAALAAAAAEIVLVISTLIVIARREPVHFPIGAMLAVMTLLSALAAWVAMGEPLPDGWNSLTTNVGLVLSLGALSLWQGVWPQREFLWRLIRT